MTKLLPNESRGIDNIFGQSVLIALLLLSRMASAEWGQNDALGNPTGKYADLPPVGSNPHILKSHAGMLEAKRREELGPVGRAMEDLNKNKAESFMRDSMLAMSPSVSNEIERRKQARSLADQAYLAWTTRGTKGTPFHAFNLNSHAGKALSHSLIHPEGMRVYLEVVGAGGDYTFSDLVSDLRPFSGLNAEIGNGTGPNLAALNNKQPGRGQVRIYLQLSQVIRTGGASTPAPPGAGK